LTALMILLTFCSIVNIKMILHVLWHESEIHVSHYFQ